MTTTRKVVDVDVTGLTTGDVPVYNSSTQTFERGAVSGGGPAKEQTVDITSGDQTVSLANGRILKFTGTNAGTPTITITPNATTQALADTFEVRNLTSPARGLIFTRGTGTTILVGAGRASLSTSTDGVTGTWFDSATNVVVP